MAELVDIARAAIAGEALSVHSLAQEWLSEHTPLSQVPPPEDSNETVRIVAAALVELFALRRGEPAPAWSAQVGALNEPLFLLRYAATMPRLRRMCEQEAPEPLRRRRIFAPADYLAAE